MKKNRIAVAAVLAFTLALTAMPAFAATDTKEPAKDTDTKTTTSAIDTKTTAPAIDTKTTAPAIDTKTTAPAIDTNTTTPAVKVEPASQSINAEVSLNSMNIKVNDSVAAVTGTSYALDNGTEVPYSILYNGTTYLPMRKVGELVGKDIAYDNATKTASITSTTAAVKAVVPDTKAPNAGTKESATFSVNSLNIVVDGQTAAKVGESYALADGSKVPFSLLYKGTTYLPMRKVGELVGKDIVYDNATKTAQIKDKADAEKPEAEKPEAEKPAAYKDFKNVPDFGVLTSLKPLKTETVDGATVYSYDIKALKEAQLAAHLDTYEKDLTAYGFELVKDGKVPSYIQEGIVVTNKTEKTNVAAGVAVDAKAETVVFYIAVTQTK